MSPSVSTTFCPRWGKATNGTERVAASIMMCLVTRDGLAERHTQPAHSSPLSRHLVTWFTPITNWDFFEKMDCSSIKLCLLDKVKDFELSSASILDSDSGGVFAPGWTHCFFLGGSNGSQSLFTAAVFSFLLLLLRFLFGNCLLAKHPFISERDLVTCECI